MSVEYPNLELGRVQVAIERIVRKNNISTLEWNTRTEKVEELLGPLLQQRDSLIKQCVEAGM